MKRCVDVMIIGAGSRGMYTFGELCKREDVHIKVVAVAEPNKEKRDKMMKEHEISPEFCFKSGEIALSSDRFCDAIINATPDRSHHKLTIMAIKKGYNILLEKPISSSPQECIEIVETQKKYGGVLSLAHVLRYSPFFQEMKKIIDSKRLGKMLSVDLLEEVGYWHFAHSYIRGNWRKKDESGPIILTKSCHDLDILTFLVGSDVSSIVSSGSLSYFKRENSPKGSTRRCVENCKIKKNCPYNSERFYLMEKDSSKIDWPTTVLSPIDKSISARKRALKNGPYGKCVFRCDNDVCDNQVTQIKFKNGVSATFKLIAFGQESTRKIKIYLEKGEINGDLSKGSIRVVEYKGLRYNNSLKQEHISYGGGHGGGDEFLLKNFVRTILKGDEKSNLSNVQDSLQSHLMAFAAEESRLKKKVLNFQKWKKKLKY